MHRTGKKEVVGHGAAEALENIHADEVCIVGRDENGIDGLPLCNGVDGVNGHDTPGACGTSSSPLALLSSIPAVGAKEMAALAQEALLHACRRGCSVYVRAAGRQETSSRRLQRAGCDLSFAATKEASGLGTGTTQSSCDAVGVGRKSARLDVGWAGGLASP